ncbi:MAG: two-component system chemotaxis family sensor kinase CheA [Planctomycetota bacterium]|nr:MAG: two-component system chemotaxis family sensor kinase CheA [Planctomycetota bacterium]
MLHHDELSLADSSIRVDVALLDKLMTRIGELVLTRNQILQQIANSNDLTFVKAAQRLNLITSELQEDVMKTRMQPIGTVWNKFPRVVRDLSAQLGKQVRIEMDGQETELDKTIVEAIKDPLTHIVRNSVDHGIERPDVRLKAGKPAEGQLLLRAFHESGQVNIEITDDGAGLKLDRIRAKALEVGVCTADELSRMSDRETALLIFAPGFSTAEKVTNVSGRGVGMDIVKTNIEKVGGEIELVNRPGQGLTIKIKIPLTLAIIPALIVMSDGDRYAIPQVSLIELLRIDTETASQKIEFVGGAPVYRLRGKLLPLLFLSERLGVTTGLRADERVAKGAVNIVVLQANDRQFGLIVDRVCDTEEIVVKPLSRQLQHLAEYAGATIMGDGTVSLILDVLGLAVTSGLATPESTKSLTSTDEQRSDQKTTSMLLVDLGDSRRFALPTSSVSRLEKVDPQTIEFADGREVIQYRGSILPLVVGRIVDIVETELALNDQQRVDDDLLGTAVIHERVTDIVNVPHLANSRSHRAGRNPSNRCGGPA